MQTCTRCKISKDESNFNFKYKTKGIRQYHCKECSRLYVQSHYKNNREYYLAKARRRNSKLRQDIKQYIWNYFQNHSCIDCGEKDPIVLEFDHIREKDFTISRFSRDHTLERVKNEIEKCEVRCANCHRRKTAVQFGWHKNHAPVAQRIEH